MNIYTIYIFGFIALLFLAAYALEKINQIKTGKKDRMITFKRTSNRIGILLSIVGLILPVLPIIFIPFGTWSSVPTYGLILIILSFLVNIIILIRRIIKENDKLKNTK